MSIKLLSLLCILGFGVHAQPGCPSLLSTTHIPGPDTIANDYDQTFRSLVVNPFNPDHVITGTEGNGIFISYDGGQHWRWERDGFRHFVLDGYAETWFMIFDPKDTSVIYASTADSPGPTTGSFSTAGAGVYKSTDHGQSWNQRNCGLPASSATAIWCHSDSSNNLLVSIAGGTPSFTGSPQSFYAGGIYYSQDSGASWIKANTPVNMDTVACWKFLNAGDTVFTCIVSNVPGRALGFMKSYDKGRTWTMCNNAPLAGRMMPDFALANDGRHIAAVVRDSALVFTSADGGDSWSRINISVSGVMTYHPQSTDTIFFSDQNLLYKSRNGITTGNLSSPDYKLVATFSHYIEKIVFAPSDPMVMYVSTRGYRVYKSTDGGETFSLMVKLRDVMNDSMYLTVDSLMLGTDTITGTAESDTISVAVMSNTDWIVSNAVGWISMSANNGSGNAVLNIAIAANMGVARSATITVAAGSIERTIYVSQAMPADLLSLGSDTLSSTAYGDTLSVSLTCNTAWTVSSPIGWVVVNPPNGNGNGVLEMVIEPNPGAARSATITVTAGSIIRTIYVSQEMFVESLSLNPDTLTSSSAGDTIPVQLSSNSSWTVNNPVSWITLNHLGGSGNDLLDIMIAANAGAVRSAVLSVTTGNITRTLYVTQHALFIGSLAIGTDTINSPFAGSSEFVQVTSNTAWTVNNPAAWVSINPVSGNGNDSLSVLVAANTGAARTATVSVIAGMITRTFYVSQALFDPGLALGEDTIESPASGSVTPVALSCTTGWTVTNPAAWLTVAPMAGTGNATLSCTVSANTADTLRMAIVSVNSGSHTQVFYIIQEASVTGLETVIAPEYFSLYPNPTSGKVVLKNERMTDAEAEVFDLNGKSTDHFTAKGGAEIILDYSGWNTGLYVMLVTTAYGRNTLKFMISK
jgi:hypothetical protein